MKRISIFKAIRTAIICYTMGEDLKIAFKTAFEMRTIFNDMIDAGYTQEMIQHVWDEAQRRQILREAEQRS